jgi:hypothetical protein
MTPEAGGSATDAPARKDGWLARVPLWARIAVPAVIVVGGAAVVAGFVAAGSAEPATVESLCASAAEKRLETRGHSDIELDESVEVTEADGAQRVSGNLTFVDEEGDTHHALVRCVVRGEGDEMRVVSVRFFD